MKTNQRILALSLLPLAGFAVGVLSGIDLSPARAGGICQTPVGYYITSNEAGDTIYKWITPPGKAQVTRYSFQTGEATRKLLVVTEGKEVEPKPPVDRTEETPEIVISGVIWTSNPEKRVAIINGKTVREGEIFVTRSGKKYRVIEIKRSDEVVYREVKD